MSLNLDKVGRHLAIIEGGKLNKKIVSVFSDGFDNEDIKKQFTSLQLTQDSKFQQIPDAEKEREILYITGASGSGKSTYTANYIKQYRKIHKKNEVYVFSALKEDESLDIINPKRIKVDKSLVEEPLTVDDFENSLVVFDDIDVISDKAIRGAVYDLLNSILEVGRHLHISCISTNHLPTAGKETRRILNEAHSITYFPHSGSKRGLNYLLGDYIGMTNEEILKIKKMKTRWATIFKNYPQIAMTERNIFLLSED